jgi:hypothetical protein
MGLAPLGSMTIRQTLQSAILAAALAAFAFPALAQDDGLRAGASADPDQFYFGAHLETGPLVEDLRFRPNLEVGVGSDLTHVGANFEFVYPVRLDNSAWSFYPGLGPALNVYSFNGNREVEGGMNILLGLEHDDGLFVEF